MFWVILCLVYGFLVLGSALIYVVFWTPWTSVGGVVAGSLLVTAMRVGALCEGLSSRPKPVRELCEQMSNRQPNAGILGGALAWVYDIVMSLLACGTAVGLFHLLVRLGLQRSAVERNVTLGAFMAVIMLPFFFPFFCSALLRLVRAAGKS